MRLEITDKERELLLELIEQEQKQLIQELNHTDSRDYKALLRGRLDVLEGLLAKV
jgi:predicted transcriptional regulator